MHLRPRVEHEPMVKIREIPERVKLWRMPGHAGVELMHATYVRQTFARHDHEGFAVGVIERGALGFHYRGEDVVASPGEINLANPGEAHTGHAAGDEGWTYRMFYLDTSLLGEAASQIACRPRGMPFFKPGVIRDRALAGVIRGLHMALENKEAPALARESGLLSMLAGLVTRHADDPPPLRPVGRERLHVSRARTYIEEHFSEDLSIATLSSIAGLSPFYFFRAFSRETGLTPHAYLVQARVRRARGLLDAGLPAATAALEAGFSDQSHLTRHFKRIFGITPGRYGNIVQDHRCRAV